MTVSPDGAPTLILVCGLPGAGKTTLARRLEAERPAVRLCPDEWLTALGIDLHEAGETSHSGVAPLRDRLEARLTAHAADLLRLGQSVILEYGFWAREERDRLRDMARALGVRVELHALLPSANELWRRLEVRNGEAPWGTARITRAQLEAWSALFQAPDAVELAAFDAPP